MPTPKPKSQAQLKARREKRRKMVARALEMRKKGETMGYIASEIGVSKGTVWLWINTSPIARGAAQEQKAS